MMLVLGASLEAVSERRLPESAVVPLLELQRRQVSDRRVPTLRVVPALDELKHDRRRHRLVVEAVPREQFALERGAHAEEDVSGTKEAA